MDALRADWLASLGLFVLISAFYLCGFLCGSTGKSCHGTFNKRQQAQKFPFTHRIIARFQRPRSGASSEFYAGIAISTILPKRYAVSIPKRPFKKPLSNSNASICSWWGETAAQQLVALRGTSCSEMPKGMCQLALLCPLLTTPRQEHQGEASTVTVWHFRHSEVPVSQLLFPDFWGRGWDQPPL